MSASTAHGPGDGWVGMQACLVKGFQKASGLVPYLEPHGTIRAQLPHFKERGLDLYVLHPGTLNLSIRPYSFRIRAPLYAFQGIEWSKKHRPENFSFCRCKLAWRDDFANGWVYYPHRETKHSHFHDDSTLEVIAPHLPGAFYGEKFELFLHGDEVDVRHAKRPIFHVTARPEWLAAEERGEYLHASLDREGFIHCSEAGQIEDVLARYFADADELVALQLDPERLEGVLRYDMADNLQIYPHIYSPISLSAVTGVHEIARGEDGRFVLPALA